ncbi:MAG TPA: hypothetical protein VGK74_02245 [Symbiobacteriaceae bacterium]
MKKGVAIFLVVAGLFAAAAFVPQKTLNVIPGFYTTLRISNVAGACQDINTDPCPSLPVRP